MNIFFSLVQSRKKLTLFMLFCLISISVSNLKAQNVTLSHHSKSLKEAMNEIEKQTGYKFFYNNSQINVDKIISFSSKNEKLSSVLARIFKNTNISYKIAEKTILLSIKNNTHNPEKKVKTQVVSGNILYRVHYPNSKSGKKDICHSKRKYFSHGRSGCCRLWYAEKV